MFGRECSLCGGKLRGNICVECGLDNSKNDDSYKTSSSHSDFENLTHSHEKTDPFAGKTLTKEQKKELKSAIAARKKTVSHQKYEYGGQHTKYTGKRKKPAPVKIIILFVIIYVIIGVVTICGTFFSGSGYEEVLEPEYDYETNYDPYEYALYDLEYTGDSYRETFSAGSYMVGTHIPEGSYEVLLESGKGTLDVKAEEHSIYIYENFYEEQEGDFVMDDLRLYDGARVEIGESAVLVLQTENAVFPTESMENPNTESYIVSEHITVGDEVQPGVYDLHCLAGAGMFDYTVEFEDGNSTYESKLIGEEGSSSGFPSVYKNVVLPEGQEIDLIGLTVELIPSECIVDENYLEYYR